MFAPSSRLSRFGVASAGLAGLFCLAACQARSQTTTTNLLTNPGAETGSISGWTVGGTSNPNVDNGSFDPGINPHTGSFDFYGVNGVSGTLSQNVTLVGTQGITAAMLDSGLLTANLQFFEQGLNQAPTSDDASVTLTFLGAGNNTLSSVTTPEVDSHNGVWQVYNNTYVLPTGVRTLTYTMNFIRHFGSDLDAFVDDNSLTITTPAPATVPEPGSTALLATSALTGAGFLICRRKRARIAA